MITVKSDKTGKSRIQKEAEILSVRKNVEFILPTVYDKQHILHLNVSENNFFKNVYLRQHFKMKSSP